MSILAGLSGAERVRLVIAAMIIGGLCFLGLTGGIVALALFDKDVVNVMAALGAVVVVCIPALGTLIYAKASQAVSNTNGTATRNQDFQQDQQGKLLDALRESHEALRIVAGRKPDA